MKEPPKYDLDNPGPDGIYMFDGSYFRKYHNKRWYFSTETLHGSVEEDWPLNACKDQPYSLFRVADVTGPGNPLKDWKEARRVGDPKYFPPAPPPEQLEMFT